MNNDKKQRNHERHKSIMAEQAPSEGSRKRKTSEDIEEVPAVKRARTEDFN
jgi:hypothetical protein